MNSIKPCLAALGLALLSSLNLHAQDYPTYFIVAQDGSGDYTSVQEAVSNCKSFPDVRITILIKKGIYREKVEIHSWNTRITLLGEERDSTIITFNDSAGNKKNGTFWTYTLKVLGNDSRVENLTIKNSAGQVGQAVALHVEADRVVFKNCNILGNQDTLYAAGENSRQLYDHCYIDGTTDYIFGPGTEVFRNCTIHSKKDSYVTAASTPQRIPFGFIFFDCILTFADSVSSVYLGRPWRMYAHTVFIRCDLGDKIHPQGWQQWSNKDNVSTTFYAEYNCTGKSTDRSRRVAWSHELTDEQAAEYTLENIFSGKFDRVKDEEEWYR